eukprot:6198533-Pleurochrysis_carterae.AAC.2
MHTFCTAILPCRRQSEARVLWSLLREHAASIRKQFVSRLATTLAAESGQSGSRRGEATRT